MCLPGDSNAEPLPTLLSSILNLCLLLNSQTLPVAIMTSELLSTLATLQMNDYVSRAVIHTFYRRLIL